MRTLESIAAQIEEGLQEEADKLHKAEQVAEQKAIHKKRPGVKDGYKKGQDRKVHINVLQMQIKTSADF